MSIKIIHCDEPKRLKMFNICPIGTVFDIPCLYHINNNVVLFVKVDNETALSLLTNKFEYFDPEEMVCDRNIEVIIH